MNVIRTGNQRTCPGSLDANRADITDSPKPWRDENFFCGWLSENESYGGKLNRANVRIAGRAVILFNRETLRPVFVAQASLFLARNAKPSLLRPAALQY